ncbi:hypothetical protein GCM10020001_082630 [Nonomuraea salmonea]
MVGWRVLGLRGGGVGCQVAWGGGVVCPEPSAGGVACQGASVVVVGRGGAVAARSYRRRAASAAGSRAPGSRRSSPMTIGPSAPARAGGSGSSRSTAATVAAHESRLNGGRPSTAVYSVAPSDHRSDSGRAGSPLSRSGGMYAGVPTSPPVAVSPASASMEAMPKSVSTTRPSSASSTFSGLTSRCSTPVAWAARSASSTRPPITAACAGRSGPSSEITLASERERTSCMTIHGRPSSSTTSWMTTTDGWSSRPAALASRMVRRLSSARLASPTPV